MHREYILNKKLLDYVMSSYVGLIDDGFDEFIMITADPHALSRNKRKNMQNTRCS